MYHSRFPLMNYCCADRDILMDKHPPGERAPSDALIDPSNSSQCYDPIIFEQITGEVVKQAALHTHGAAGPSGVDAFAWRRFCSSFQGASTDLCNAMAAVARRLCTVHVHPVGLDAFVACRLIPLNKNPGVRPIGIGEVSRRIIAKAVLRVVRDDVQSAAGPLQTCAGFEAGNEAAVHAMKEIFSYDDTEAALMVDASNAFNVINRQAALHNIHVLCPAIFTILNNTYQRPITLYIPGEGEILSSEGTTQGDPLAMAMYALAVRPLIDKLRLAEPSTRQVWFADDATAAGKLHSLHQWWQNILTIGPKFGYFPNARKTFLVVKPALVDEANRLFKDSNVKISTTGQRLLGAALGSLEFAEAYAAQKITKWVLELDVLTTIARIYPHAAYTAFSHGMIGRWTYLMRTLDISASIFQPLEDAIHQRFLPTLTAQMPFSQGMRKLVSLPTRLGGLNITNPVETANWQMKASKVITCPLKTLIIEQSDEPVHPDSIKSAKHFVSQERRHIQAARVEQVCNEIPDALKRSRDLAAEKGASTWLTVLPLKDRRFNLTKQEFHDARAVPQIWMATKESPKSLCLWLTILSRSCYDL